MTDQDPRVETIRHALKILTKGRTVYDDHPVAQADRSLTSLARDARKAALAEAVVEAAERVRQTTPGRSLIVRGDVLQRLYDETAAFRAEFPADPQEKP